MRGVWTVAEIRAAEDQALAGAAAGALMDRAALAVAVAAKRLIAERSGGVYGRTAVLLVGAGNNGGDALFAGAYLARQGVQVSAVLVNPDKAHKAGLREFRLAGGRVVDALPDADVAVDGILGLGGRPGLQDRAAELAAELQRRAIPVVAVDAPSGIDVDTGAVPGPAIRAARTVTFGGLKPGLVLGAGAEHAGEVRLADVGITPTHARIHVLEAADVAVALPVPDASADKYTRGVVGVVAGSPQYGGAGVLCTGAAVRGGSGMVRYAGAAPDAIRARWPEVVVHEDVEHAGQVQAWVVGPGIGTDDAASDSLALALYSDVPVLIDADGLTLLASDWFKDAIRDRTQPTVLTPHDREFERLFGEVGDDRLGATRRAAEKSGAVVLLKGNTTVVAAPDGRAFVNRTGTPWLGTAGSGDVLSGLIGAALAGGVDPPLAAAAGAFVHGVAGQLAALDGPPSAEDVLGALRRALDLVLTGDLADSGA